MPTRKHMVMALASATTALAYLGFYRGSELNSTIEPRFGVGLNSTDSFAIDGKNLTPRQITFGNKTATLNPYGATEAESRHEILKELGLIPPESKPIQKVPVTVNTNSSLPIKNISLEGYIVSPSNYSEATPQQKKDFIEKNNINLITAGLLGIDFRALKEKIVIVNGASTLLADHTVGTPHILYETQKNFQNSTDTEHSFSRNIEPETKTTANKIYHHDATFKKLQAQRLESILKNYGADSEIYKTYEENYREIEKFLKSDEKFLNNEHYVFKGINSISANGENDVIVHPDSYDLRSPNGQNPLLQKPYVLGKTTAGAPLLPIQKKENSLVEVEVQEKNKEPSSSLKASEASSVKALVKAEEVRHN